MLPVALVCCIAGILVGATVAGPLVNILQGALDDEAVGDENLAFLVLSPESGTILIETVPELSWESYSEADRYRVQIASDAGFEDIITDQITDSTAYRPDAQDLSNGTYYWRVAAYADGTWGEWSEANSFTILPSSISVTYSWTFYMDGSEWTIGLNVSAEDYNEARSQSRESMVSVYEFAEYVLSYDPYVLEIAEELRSMAEDQGYDRYTTACFVLSFVQSMTYDSDLNTTGYEEYPRYPVETIVDGTGDCEDTAILFASLIQSSYFGMDAILVYLESDTSTYAHMAVGLQLSFSDVPNQVRFDYENETYMKSKMQLLSWDYRSHRTYYYCEGTAALPIGWPTEMAYWDYILIPC